MRWTTNRCGDEKKSMTIFSSTPSTPSWYHQPRACICRSSRSVRRTGRYQCRPPPMAAPHPLPPPRSPHPWSRLYRRQGRLWVDHGRMAAQGTPQGWVAACLHLRSRPRLRAPGSSRWRLTGAPAPSPVQLTRVGDQTTRLRRWWYAILLLVTGLFLLAPSPPFPAPRNRRPVLATLASHE